MKFSQAAAVAVMAAIGLVSAGCTPGSSSDSPAKVTGTRLTNADVAKAGNITLTMTDFETTGGLSPALDRLIKQFEAKYPNITIKRSSKDFNNYGKTISLTMSSNTAPDIAEANVVMARSLVPAGLIKPLNAYYQAYGWAQRYPSSVLGLLQSANGKTFGEGNFWGQALGGNMVGVYYNKSMLSALGLTVPTTYAEFVNDLNIAKSKGKMPIQLGNLDQYPANHVFSTVLNAFADPQAVRDWINGKSGATFDSPGVIQAAQELQNWAKEGYLPSQTNGTKYDDAVAAFGKGDGLFYITGSWEEPIFANAMHGNVGFFVLPPKSAGQVPYPTGWLANPFTISKNSKHADIAAFFLDYMSGTEGAPTAVAGGFLPFTNITLSAGEPVQHELIAAWQQAIKQNSLVPYLDFATPSMNTTLFPNLQSLIASKMTASQVATAAQRNWASYHGT
jgi:raffinose/stachyose/melibiose transport system substrate-binding protein